MRIDFLIVAYIYPEIFFLKTGDFVMWLADLVEV
jgi:hypothetical protein